MSDTQKPKRRWFQFSLQALLVIVTLFAVLGSCFAVKMRQANRQRETVMAIEKWGGYVAYEHLIIGPGGSPLPPEEQPGPVCLRSLLGNDFFNNIGSVGLNEINVTDAEIEHLTKGLRVGRKITSVLY
jgi:hypothetical protein